MRLHTFEEGAAILGISARTLRGWAAAGKVAVVRLSPRVIRIQSEELLRLVAESRVDAERRPGGRS